MKFGFESEKLLYDLNEGNIYHGVFRLVDALSDYISFHGADVPKRITNEFVLNMVEMNTLASPSIREVMEDYLLLYLIVKDVARRENVVPLPLAAVPFHFTPNMVPKWQYYVQNSILSLKRQKVWTLTEDSPMADAGNCAGLHAHFEVETLPEYLGFTSELVDKHNLALMLVPMTAFSSSPYFLSTHTAQSMRCMRYYFGVYANFPLNGGLPPVFTTSEEVLRYAYAGVEAWINHGKSLGFPESDLKKLTSKKGANWSVLRWNRTWNTIELRCLESDRIDYDLSKLAWVSGAMRRTDIRGEALKPVVENPLGKLDEAAVDRAFHVEDGKVSILSTLAIHELIRRSVQDGLNDPLVRRYLARLSEFARPGVEEDCLDVFSILVDALERKESTSSAFLIVTGGKKEVTQEECVPILKELVHQDRLALDRLRKIFPAVIPKTKNAMFPSFGA